MRSGRGTMTAAYPEEFLSGKLTQVDVARIEKELRQLWQSAESTEPDSERPAVARACALNLILYSMDLDAETTASNLLDEISISHPCRALLAISRPGEHAHLEAWVSARCHLPTPGASRQICCEQITVRWEGEGIYQLPSVVLPLLVSDLPVFLWWRTGSFDHPALSPFLPAVDRLIIDSSRWLAPLSAFCQLASCLAEGPNCPILSDLTWRRIMPWREAIASAFDTFGSGLSVPDLGAIVRVNMAFDRPSQAQPALATAWLASRLGWKPVFVEDTAGGGIQLTFARRKRKMEVQWQPHAGDATGTGGLRTVDILWPDGKQLKVSLVRKDEKPVLAIRSSAAPHFGREILAPGPDLSEPHVVSGELDVFEHDRVFESCLGMLADIGALYEEDL